MDNQSNVCGGTCELCGETVDILYGTWGDYCADCWYTEAKETEEKENGK